MHRRDSGPVGPAKSAAIKSSQRYRMIGIGAVVLVAIVAVVVVVALFGGRSYEDVIRQYFDATYKMDMRRILDLFPQEVLDTALEESGYRREDLNDMMDTLSNTLESELDVITDSLGEDWELTYEIVDDDDMSNRDLRDLQERYETYGVEVDAAKTVEVEITVSGADRESSNTINIPLIKSGRSWYLDVENAGLLF